jgi:mxaK protein
MQFSRARNANLTVRALAAGHDMPVAMSAPPLVVLARARLLADKGELPSAQALADELANAPASIEAPLHYALGNAYMRVALARMRKAPFWKVKPIFAVAKSEYRLAIQLDAGNWDARYNYAVASMFLRDSEQAQPTIGTGMAHERAAWPDIPGAPNGMP